MAAILVTGQVATSSTPTTLFELLRAAGKLPSMYGASSTTARIPAGYLILQADTGNSAPIFWSAVNTVTAANTDRGGFIAPGGTLIWDPRSDITLSSLWMVSAAAQTLFITAVIL